MSSRRERDGEPTRPWWIGAARYEEGLWIDQKKLIVATRCRLGDLGVMQALFDTGAEWSIVGDEIAEELITQGEKDIARELRMDSRFGKVKGHLYRLNISLVADEGSDLRVESTLLLAPEWEGPPVLGYKGFLERIRFALDPGTASGDGSWFFFGSD